MAIEVTDYTPVLSGPPVTPAAHDLDLQMARISNIMTPTAARRNKQTLVKGCWATLLTKASYLQGVLVLNATLRAVGSKYPLVVMATPQLSEDCRNVLRSASISVIEVESIYPPPERHSLVESDHRFRDTWTKLRAFELIHFDRVILIDCDMLVFQNMDELMELELPGEDYIAACHACTCNPRRFAHYPQDWTPENCAYSVLSSNEGSLQATPITPTSPRTHKLLNSGLVVLTPSMALLETIINFIHTSPEVPGYRFPDQDALAAVFVDKWIPLPYIYNALKTLRTVHKSLWRDNDVKNIHYILDKPWDVVPSPSAIWPTTGSDYADVHEWWWHKYRNVLADMKQLPGSGWEIVDAHVSH
ncbi:hypothetical protein QFC19_002315 [Naganishia cerealis]|uniref:Uncharacterized protein n=1 Tax=Naganishia cerealis TaxID=610337 RepID=A0ACC2WAX3_9TREE|nr:hypothetical protein QFC19_002315 [Naganishia cerealis]